MGSCSRYSSSRGTPKKSREPLVSCPVRQSTSEQTAPKPPTNASNANQRSQSSSSGSYREMRAIRRQSVKNYNREVTMTGVDFSSLSKPLQFKLVGKQIHLGHSPIHNWGIFALEGINPEEFIVEYIGEKVRPLVAEIREKRYLREGIGSAYLFRLDHDAVIDATKFGNWARFMNHSCTPNAYSKIIVVDGRKKIGIFSKSTIKIGEEITYDYKFPVEGNKISCRCGSSGCRGYLN